MRTVTYSGITKYEIGKACIIKGLAMPVTHKPDVDNDVFTRARDYY